MEGQVGEKGLILGGLWGSSGGLSLGWDGRQLVRGEVGGKRGQRLQSG